MNNHMWEHPATQANLETLRARGVTVLEPGAGALASKGEWGAGRLPEPRRAARGRRGARPGGRARSWTGCACLVTAGGTREPIDSRALRRQPLLRAHGLRARRRGRRAGAEVDRRRGQRRPGARARAFDYVDVETAAELQDACAALRGCDVLLMAAAVADFRPAGGGRRASSRRTGRRRS